MPGFLQNFADLAIVSRTVHLFEKVIQLTVSTDTCPAAIQDF